ncbi:MAG: hypothetical protein K1X44_07450 [Alphaproteobacteria bacterium]|nr:hypothetical protein [Alphaproteobacteria bacterium]
MVANLDPIFIKTTKTSQAVATLANNDVDDNPVGTVLLTTSGNEGSIVTNITALARASLASSMACYLYLSKDNGVTQRLLSVKLMASFTFSPTTAQIPVDFGYSETLPLKLEAGDQIYCGIATALVGGVVFTCQRQDY